MMVNHALHQRRVLLGVTGGIAAYKAVMTASGLTQAGAFVDVVMTAAATCFVAPLSFEGVTRRAVYTDPGAIFEIIPDLSPDARAGDVLFPHIALAKAADLLIIAPATANTLAKLAHGQADNLLTAIALATPAPLLIAPAMESHMWEHAATQANVATLSSRGVTLVGPGEGHLASGQIGVGRMCEPEQIVDMACVVLGRKGDWAGRRVVVSAGGTREAIDPVRFISNRSSGKMGFAVAMAARDRGADVTLVTAPTSLRVPAGMRVIRVESAQDMLSAVLESSVDVDVLIMAAAVADYRPVEESAHKIKKSDDNLKLSLTRTPDILTQVAQQRSSGRGPKICVGFAAETRDLLDNARAKLHRKKLDLMVANDVSAEDAGFGADSNRVTLLWPDSTAEVLPLTPKQELAHAILDRVGQLF